MVYPIESIQMMLRREEGKYEEVKELRNDPEVMSAVRRGLEAWRKDDRIHWNEVKTGLGLF